MHVLPSEGKEANGGKGTGMDKAGESARCETYIWIAKREELEEREWDFDEFVREKMRRWVGEDKEYDGELRPSIRGML